MKIELTERDIAHIMDALHERAKDLREEHRVSGLTGSPAADLADELQDLEHDLLEAAAERDDWDRNDAAPTFAQELAGRSFLVSEDDFFDAGTKAREQQKLNNRLMRGTINPTHVDIWSLSGLEDK